MKTISAAVVLLLALSPVSFAAEVAGVQMEQTETVEGKTLKLNGMGLRTKFIVKVYVAGLYLENPSKDAAAIIASDQVKRVRMVFVRGVTGSKISEGFAEGFQRNSRAQVPALEARLGRFAAMIPDVVPGGLVMLTYVPGKGTMVFAKGVEKGVIEGKDFADSLISIWLGPDPVQEDLKKALLGS